MIFLVFHLLSGASKLTVIRMPPYRVASQRALQDFVLWLFVFSNCFAFYCCNANQNGYKRNEQKFFYSLKYPFFRLLPYGNINPVKLIHGGIDTRI